MKFKLTFIPIHFFLLALLMTACQVPTSTPANPAATEPSDASILPSETQAVPPEPGGSITRILVQALDNTLEVVDTHGQATPLIQADRPFNSPLFHNYPSSRMAGGIFYALSLGDEGLTRAYAIDSGGIRLVPFVEGVSQGLAVWPGDGSGLPRMAWDSQSFNAENNTVSSRLVAGYADGSVVGTLLEEASPDRALVVGRWSRDGQRLYFSKEPLGLGGYIVFGGASNLWAYNLADGSAASLLAEPGAACIDDLSPDETLIVHHCTNPALNVVKIASGGVTTIHPPSQGVEANFSGSARFSPDGHRVAFGIARGDPNNEQGWVAVSDGLDGNSRLVATAPAGQYFQVAAWLDDQTLILQSWGVSPGVWLVNLDGSDLRQISEGVFHGLYE